ncbi:hypothetical protein N7526_003632 [Penicillium atrosanguineum]|nr:hypothetical protein N7526_003632 [Penicillium atrosanguineum]
MLRKFAESQMVRTSFRPSNDLGRSVLFIDTGDLRMFLKFSSGNEAVFLSALRKIRHAIKANKLPIMGFGI